MFHIVEEAPPPMFLQEILKPNVMMSLIDLEILKLEKKLKE